MMGNFVLFCFASMHVREFRAGLNKRKDFSTKDKKFAMEKKEFPLDRETTGNQSERLTDSSKLQSV